jgi:transposase
MLAMLIGIEGAEVLAFVEDEEGPAFGILIETPICVPSCPTCGGAVEACGSVTEELPPTAAGPAHMLIRWKRRQWRCMDAGCTHEVFGEHNDSVEAFIERVTRRRRSSRSPFR